MVGYVLVLTYIIISLILYLLTDHVYATYYSIPQNQTPAESRSIDLLRQILWHREIRLELGSFRMETIGGVG